MTSPTDSGLRSSRPRLSFFQVWTATFRPRIASSSAFTAPPWLSPRWARAWAWRRIRSNRASPGLGAALNQAATREGMRSSAVTRGRWSTRFISLLHVPPQDGELERMEAEEAEERGDEEPRDGVGPLLDVAAGQGREGTGHHREQEQRDDRRHEDRRHDVGRQEGPHGRRQRRVDPVALLLDRSHRECVARRDVLADDDGDESDRPRRELIDEISTLQLGVDPGHPGHADEHQGEDRRDPARDGPAARQPEQGVASRVIELLEGIRQRILPQRLRDPDEGQRGDDQNEDDQEMDNPTRARVRRAGRLREGACLRRPAPEPGHRRDLCRPAVATGEPSRARRSGTGSARPASSRSPHTRRR